MKKIILLILIAINFCQLLIADWECRYTSESYIPPRNGEGERWALTFQCLPCIGNECGIPEKIFTTRGSAASNCKIGTGRCNVNDDSQEIKGFENECKQIVQTKINQGSYHSERRNQIKGHLRLVNGNCRYAPF